MRKGPSKADGLTPKQIEVLRGIGDGFSTKEIANLMKTSEKNVQSYVGQLNAIFKSWYNRVKLARIAIAFGISSLCMVCMAAAAQPLLVVSNPPPVVQLAWSPSVGAASYSVYYGIGSGQYTNRTVVGNVTNATITLPARGATFFFAVTASDSTGLESAFSNEVSYSPRNPPAPPTQKPLTVITVMKASTPTGAFADAGMNWSDTPDQPQTYYKLKIDKGIALSTATPPIPSK